MSSGPCRVEQKAPRSVSWRCTLKCAERAKSLPEEGRDVQRVTEMMRVAIEVQSATESVEQKAPMSVSWRCGVWRAERCWYDVSYGGVEFGVRSAVAKRR